MVQHFCPPLPPVPPLPAVPHLLRVVAGEALMRFRAAQEHPGLASNQGQARVALPVHIRGCDIDEITFATNQTPSVRRASDATYTQQQWRIIGSALFHTKVTGTHLRAPDVMLILRMLCVPESDTMSHAPSVETTAPYGDVYDAASRSPVRLPMTPPVPLYVVTAHDGNAPANEKYYVILPFALA